MCPKLHCCVCAGEGVDFEVRSDVAKCFPEALVNKKNMKRGSV